MANIEDVRNGLKDRLHLIEGLEGYSYVPDSPETPCGIVGFPDIEYDTTMQRGCDRFTVPVVLLVSKSIDDESQLLLDRYLAGSGELSVKECLETDRTLAGVVQSLRVTKVLDYGAAVVGDAVYMSATLEVDVIG